MSPLVICVNATSLWNVFSYYRMCSLISPLVMCECHVTTDPCVDLLYGYVSTCIQWVRSVIIHRLATCRAGMHAVSQVG